MSDWAQRFMAQVVCQRVFNKVKAAGKEGLCVLDLEDEECLTAGFLTGRGLIEIASGGGDEPYVIRTAVDEMGLIKD